MKINKIVTDEPTHEMTMTELMHNACYVKDGSARYRDYSRDVDARDFVRELLEQYAVDEFPEVEEMMQESDDEFDDSLITGVDCREPTDDIVGLIGLLYRVMVGAAELRAHLKYYEDNAVAIKPDGWIPITEQSPEKHQLVLTAMFGRDFVVINPGETLKDAADRTKKEVQRVSVGSLEDDGWYGANGYPELVTPSYWQPLPKPPKEDC